MDWSGRKVLITGAAGFIGSHLTERMARLGAVVTVFIRYNSRSDQGLLGCLPPEVRAQLRVETGDLKDPFAVESAVKGQEIVFHLAALIGIPYSYLRPLDYVQTNVLGTAHLLQACLRHGVSRVVHTSTSEVYGTARRVPIDEEHPLQAQSPYAATKIAADQLALSYQRSFGLPVAVIRPFNTYGPRQSARAVIPTIIVQALAGGPLSLGALHPTRDLTFVEDTVEGFVRVAESTAAAGTVVNVGSGREISVGDLAARISALVGGSAEIRRDEVRVRPEGSEVERLLADVSRCRELLGWSPRIPLAEGLRRTIDWIREHPAQYPRADYCV